ncbi:dTMP kinase [Candidatus Aenigmatarchaeota archaeon]
MAGKFIVFEGLDGSGLTTQATMLKNYLLAKNKKVALTKEPTDGLIGGIIKARLRSEWKTSSKVLQMLFAADRAHHVENQIEPALRSGKTVICDRYILSTLAFGVIDVPLKMLNQLNSSFRKPNMTFIIDTQPKICIERIKKSRPQIEIYEEENKLQQIRRNYKSLKNYFPDTYVIDGNRDVNKVFEDVQKIITKNMLRPRW